MKLVTMLVDGRPRAGLVDGDAVIDINAADPALPQSMKQILEANALERVRKLIGSSKHRIKGAKLLAPIADPRLVLSCGMNYHEHLKEMKTPVPEKPAAFTKSVASIIGPDESIRLPPSNPSMVDWEGEFSVVIGRACHNVKAAEAMDYVFGYTLINDVSARDWSAGVRTQTGIMGPILAWDRN